MSGPGSLWQIQALTSSTRIVAWRVCSETQENVGSQESIGKGPRPKIIIELNTCLVPSQVFCKFLLGSSLQQTCGETGSESLSNFYKV